jgi:arylsulfatase
MAPSSRLDLDPNPRTRLDPEYFRNLLVSIPFEMQRRPVPQSIRHTTRWFVTAGLALSLAFACACSGKREPRLFVLISVDTLRADRLGASGLLLPSRVPRPPGLTPRLDALAAQSHHFESAYAPSAFTLPSVASMLTGRLPEEIGIASNRSALAGTIPTLATRLREQGWSTRAVVSNFVLRRNSGLAAGFDHYDDDMPQREIVREWPERIAEDTTAAFESLLDDWLGADATRGFFWVHYQDPHGPYTPPEGFRERRLAFERQTPDGSRRLAHVGRGGRGALPSYQQIDDRRDVAFYRAGYHGEIAYLDAEIGRLLDGLDARNLRDEAVVVFTADHGEALGENDYWFAHGERLGDAQVRVPLLIRAPGFAPERRDDVASLTDLVPTLLALAGLDATAQTGRDLLGPGGERRDSTVYLATLSGAVEPRFGWIEREHKLVVTPSTRAAQLFRRDADGGETPVEDAAVAARLRDRLDAFRAALPRGAVEIRQQLDSADRDRLRALGYAEPEADSH